MELQGYLFIGLAFQVIEPDDLLQGKAPGFSTGKLTASYSFPDTLAVHSAARLCLSKSSVHNIATDGICLYAMTSDQGVLKLNEEGKGCLKWDTGLGNGNYTYQIQKVGERLLAGQVNGIYKSDTQGLTWELITARLPQIAFPKLLVTHFGVIASTAVRSMEGC